MTMLLALTIIAQVWLCIVAVAFVESQTAARDRNHPSLYRIDATSALLAISYPSIVLWILYAKTLEIS